MANHQRLDATSNTQAGAEFEAQALEYFARNEGLVLVPNYSLEVGVGSIKKPRRFDLGNEATLIECKSYRWTESGGVPHAKLKNLTEAMYYFHLTPASYRKILFVLKATHPKHPETLAEYYIRIYRHLIPDDVSILEYDLKTQSARILAICPLPPHFMAGGMVGTK